MDKVNIIDKVKHLPKYYIEENKNLDTQFNNLLKNYTELYYYSLLHGASKQSKTAYNNVATNINSNTDLLKVNKSRLQGDIQILDEVVKKLDDAIKEIKSDNKDTRGDLNKLNSSNNASQGMILQYQTMYNFTLVSMVSMGLFITVLVYISYKKFKPSVNVSASPSLSSNIK